MKFFAQKQTISSVIAIFVFTLSVSFAQMSYQYDKNGKIILPNFNQLQKNAAEIWKGKENIKGNGWKAFKRIEWFMQDRLDEKGYLQSGNFYENEIQNFISKNKKNNIQANEKWTNLGPFNPPQESSSIPASGVGRVNVVSFDKNDVNTIWAGSAAGGIWKSTDGGSNWKTFDFDAFQCLGISDIAVSPLNSNVVYATTGDPDAFGSSGSINFSVGMLKTTDGGTTWNKVNLLSTLTQANNFFMYKVVINPTNDNIVYCATVNGVYKSTNAGSSWSLITTASDNCKDLVMHPTNSGILYGVFDLGNNVCSIKTYNESSKTWSNEKQYSDCSRIVLGVSPQRQDWVWALLAESLGNSGAGFRSLEKSTNGGGSWTSVRSKSNSPNYLHNSDDGLDQNGSSAQGGQGWYDLAIAVNPGNASEVYIGGVNVWRTQNAGTTMENVGEWSGFVGLPTLHADQHCLKFNAQNVLYAGNDGGVYTFSGSNWTSLNDKLPITQFYKLSVSEKNANVIISGAQDNSTSLYNGTTWKTVNGGDGMDCLINYSNPNIMYSSTPQGTIFKSTNGGLSFGSNPIISIYQTAEYGGWVTPIAIDPKTPATIYAGYQNVWKSTNNGDTWSKLGGSNGINAPAYSPIRAIAIAPSDPNYIYVAYSGNAYRSTNGGTTWSKIFTASNNITNFTVHPTTASKAYFTVAGFSATAKVYEWDGAKTNNLSLNLPNVPANAIVYQKNSKDRLYVGTDVGVFTKDNTESSWTLYGTGLPPVIISDMEIHTGTGKLKVATYGRGVWDISVNDCSISSPEITVTGSTSFCKGDSLILEYTGPLTNFTWSNGIKARKLIVKETGSYYFTVTDSKGCSANSATYEVVVTDVPVINLTFDKTKAVNLCENDSLEVTISGIFSKINWSNGLTSKKVFLKQAGKYYVNCTPIGSKCISTSETFEIKTIPAPVKPTITQENDDLIASDASSYQWYKNNVIISGATNKKYTATESAIYTVIVKGSNNCSNVSDQFSFTSSSDIDEMPMGYELNLLPNPATDFSIISLTSPISTNIVLKLTNLEGQELLVEKLKCENQLEYKINLANFAKGVYFVSISSDTFTTLRKIVKN